MTQRTPNGWAVLEPGSPRLHTWVIPGANRRITLLHGAVGLILVHVLLWFNDVIERLDGPGSDPVDEGGYNHRLMTGRDDVWSEHAGGDAADANWNRHPYNTPASHSFTARQIRLIHRRLRWLNTIALGKVVEWGGDWPSHPGSTAKPDPMHWQVNRSKTVVHLARVLSRTPRGRKILAANPGQRAVIFS